MQIAIDGPAGVGKSTIAKLLAKELDYLYLDTGAMYRAIAYAALKNGLDFNKDTDKLHFLVDENTISFDGNRVFLNDEDVSDVIRGKEVTKYVSAVAKDEKVREKLVKLQQEIAGTNDIILDGRDIGTVVLPEADFKFYMDASPELRAQRRAKDLNINENDIDALNKLKNDIILRDKKDSTRKVGALKKADDAYLIQTDDLTIREVLNKLLNIINGD